MEQIGGRRFATMTGSKDFIDMGNGLRMSLARNKTSANRLDIIYDAGADLYNMRFYRRTFSKKTFAHILITVFFQNVRGQITAQADSARSEERRVGKECRSRWSPYH